MTPEASVRNAADHLRDTALNGIQKLAHDLDGGLDELRDAVESEVDSNPIRSVLIAAGIGYVLGGGLAVPVTRRLSSLALRVMLLPLLEAPVAQLMGWIRSDPDSSPAQSNPSESTQEAPPAKGGKHHGT